MDFEQVGQLLKETRESKKLTIDEAVERTKISRRNLLAIESGRRDELPHAVYTKGFLKNYALFLGLDPEEVGESISHELERHDPAPERLGSRLDDFSSPSLADRVLNMLPALVLLLVIGASVGGGIYFWPLISEFAENSIGPLFTTTTAEESRVQSVPATEPAPQQPSAPVRSEPLPSTTGQPAAESLPALPSLNEKATPKPEGPGAPKEQTSGSSEIEPAPAPRTESKPEPEPAVAQPQTSEQGQGAVSTTEQTTEERILRLEATAPCWVSVTIDGGKRRDFYLSPGESQKVSYSEVLVVKLGNAGGVRFNLDGQNVVNEGKLGEVRTYTFD